VESTSNKGDYRGSTPQQEKEGRERVQHLINYEKTGIEKKYNYKKRSRKNADNIKQLFQHFGNYRYVIHTNDYKKSI
jgi:hypothetical protein